MIAEIIYMGMGLLALAGIPSCLYIALREYIYRNRFRRAFKIKTVPPHIKARTMKLGMAPANICEVVELEGGGVLCEIYANGWFLETVCPGEAVLLVDSLKEKGVIFSGNKEDSLFEKFGTDNVRKPGPGIVEKPLRVLFFMVMGMCLFGMLSTMLGYATIFYGG